MTTEILVTDTIDEGRRKINEFFFNTDQRIVEATDGVIPDRSILGNKLVQGAITALEIAAATITSQQIADAGIAASKLVPSSLTAAQLADDAITAAKLASGAVTGPKIAAGTITAGNIAAGTITGALIAAQTIVAGHIAAGQVSTDKLAANAIDGLTVTGAILRTDNLNTMRIDNVGGFQITAPLVTDNRTMIRYLHPTSIGQMIARLGVTAGPAQKNDLLLQVSSLANGQGATGRLEAFGAFLEQCQTQVAAYNSGKESSLKLFTTKSDWINNLASLAILKAENIFFDGKLYATGNEAWVYPTQINGWYNFGSGYAAGSYRKDAFGLVHLRGLVAGGTLGQSVFTLPIGYRPAANHVFMTMANNAVGRLDVNADGSVIPGALGGPGSNVYFSLDGVTFLAE
jgi:hypothetical protein